jgi:hypothetical protein
MNIKPIWLKYGLYYFAISFLLVMINYYIGSIPGWLSFILSFAIMYFLTKLMMEEIRVENGSPYNSYGEAFKNIFFMFTVGTILYSWLNAVWMNFIDESVKETIVDQAKSMIEFIAGLFGGGAEIDEQLSKVEDETYASLEFGKSMLNSLWTPLGAAFFALIFALFFKKDEPIERNKVL